VFSTATTGPVHPRSFVSINTFFDQQPDFAKPDSQEQQRQGEKEKESRGGRRRQQEPEEGEEEEGGVM
jgi:hypothetical protein